MKHSIQKQLHAIRPIALSSQEQDAAWNNIRTRTIEREQLSAKRKSFSVFSTFRKSVAITLIFGLSAGTVFAADSAKPGDALFPIDRALENLQLFISSEEKQSELKMKFALERVSEVKDILGEVSAHQTKTEIKEAAANEVDSPQVDTSEQSIAVATPTRGQTDQSLENDVQDNSDQKENQTEQNTDKDTSKLSTENGQAASSPDDQDETLDQKTAQSTTTADTLEEAVDQLEGEIQDEVREILDSNISDTDKKRIEMVLGTALSFLGDVKGELSDQNNRYAVEYIDLMLEEINKEIEGLPTEVAFEVDLSATKERVKFQVISSEGNKPKLQIQVDNSSTTPSEAASEEKDLKNTEPQTPKKQSTKLQIKDGDITITSDTQTEELEEDINEKETTETQPSEKDVAKTSTSSTKTPLNDDVSQKGTTTIATTTSATTSDDTSTKESSERISSNTEDGTTTVTVILKQLNKNFEISVTDQNATIHEIIQKYTAEQSTTTINQ